MKLSFYTGLFIVLVMILVVNIATKGPIALTIGLWLISVVILVTEMVMRKRRRNGEEQ
jgi:hypothetical protein